jgi:hypothetical protein
MAYKIGTATDYRDLLDQLVDFLQSKGTLGTPVYTGTGNGALSLLDTQSQAPTETWTLECSNATKVGVADYGADIASETPLLHWRFNETVGTTAQDNTANNIDGNGPRRYWGIKINSSNSTVTGVAELELRGSIGGADLTGSGTAGASNYDGTDTPAKAFDNSTGTLWRSQQTAFPMILWYDFGTPVDIREIAITAPSTAVWAPVSFSLVFSDDGVTWTDVYSFPSQSGWGATEQRVFSCLYDPTMGTAGLLSVDTNKAFTFADPKAVVASAAVSSVQLVGDAAIECVLNPSAISGTRFIMGVGAAGTGNANNYLISLWAVDGYLMIYHEYGAGNVQSVITDIPIAIGRTDHIVLSRDNAARTYELIIGGIVRHTFAYTYPASDGTNSHFLVGLDADGGNAFSGVIDEVALYAAKMSAATAKSHAEAALGHETFSVTGSVSGAQANAIVGVPYQNNYLEFLISDGSTDFIVGDDWSIGATAGELGAQAWTVNRREQDKVFLQGPGLSGTDEIYAIIKTFFDAGADYYNWQINAADGYTATASGAGQPNVSPPSYIPLWNSAIPYWFMASGRRFIVVAKVSTTYQGGYVGLSLPFSTPTQFPYPMMIAGTSAAANARWSSTALRMFCMALASQSYLRHIDGGWNAITGYYEGLISPVTKFVFHPYGGTPVNISYISTMRDGLGGAYPLTPITAINLDNGVTKGVDGELDGVFHISGFNNAAENVVNDPVSGLDHVVFHNVYRTGFHDYFALRLQ